MANIQGRRELKILLIGNSFTARNDVPGLVEQIAKAHRKKLQHRLLSIGGASLRTHWNRGEARREIESGGYDFVVLQEQSTLPIKNPARMRENVLLFDEVIKRAESRMALYMTWARQKSPQAQQAISNAYTSIAKETAAVLIPAGNAWREFLKKYKTPVLHDRDGSHPTLAGSFLAACVIFRTLFQQQISSAKLSIDGLDANEIDRLASIASRCV